MASKKTKKQKTQEKKEHTAKILGKCLSVPIQRDTQIDLKTDCDQGTQQQQKQNGKPSKKETKG